jgi:hypothetical protein
MTLFDIRVRADQLKAAGEWAQSGKDMGDVMLLVDDSMLVVYQGDDKTAFDTDGSEGSEEYVSLAPLDRDTDDLAWLKGEIKDALEGESNDAEHDALAAVASHFGIEWTSFEDREDEAS